MNKIYQIQVGPKRKQANTARTTVMALQVKRPGSDEFTNWTSPIIGFEHQEGHQYVLQIEQIPLKMRIADRASCDFKLVRIIKQFAVQ